MSRRERVLKQHVETDRLLGVDAVPVGDGGAHGAADRKAATSDVQGAVSGEPVIEVLARDAGAVGTRAPSGVHGGGAPAAALSADEKLRVLRELDETQVRTCTRCDLCQTRTQTVFGEGDANAKLMFIGEGPGQREDETGRPFVGRAGELLAKQITAMGMTREQVFIANVVKCRPPNNRAPTPVEVEACWGYLRAQIQTIMPAAIMTLGGPATKLILDTKVGITALRGSWYSFDGLQPEGPSIPVMPTFHPAYLLRSYTVENRKKVWSDLQKVMERIGQVSGGAG